MVARVRFDASIAWWARRQIGTGSETTTNADGDIEVDLKVANAEAFIGWILAFEDAAEILEPTVLRERLLARVAGVA